MWMAGVEHDQYARDGRRLAAHAHEARRRVHGAARQGLGEAARRELDVMQIPDLLDAATLRERPALRGVRALRREAPVWWHPHPTRAASGRSRKHADVVAVSRDSALFSSELKGYMPAPEADPIDLEQSRLMLLGMDPPAHTRLRGLVNRGFTPRRVARLEPRIRELCRQIVDAVLPRGECDFVTDVAGELPSYLIAELVGIPLGRRPQALRAHRGDAQRRQRRRSGGGGGRDVRLLGRRARREARAAGAGPRERAARGRDRRLAPLRSRVRPVLPAARSTPAATPRATSSPPACWR